MLVVITMRESRFGLAKLLIKSENDFSDLAALDQARSRQKAEAPHKRSPHVKEEAIAKAAVTKKMNQLAGARLPCQGTARNGSR
jgi:hypothetical protein